MSIPGVDDGAFVVTMFSSSSVDYSQIMGMRAVMGVECSVVRNCYWRFPQYLANWLMGSFWKETTGGPRLKMSEFVGPE